MSNTFFIADTHFCHAAMYTFHNKFGRRERDIADTAAEADEIMVERWNAKVKQHDKVYHLGDVVIRNKRDLHILDRLNGKKCLIKGNHDIFKLKDYSEFFYDIRGTHKLDTFILSHIPIHPESLPRWTGGNIHGHRHSLAVQKRMWYGLLVDDPRYFCVSVERIDYTPIEYEEVRGILCNR